MGLVYDELRALAAHRLQRERPDHTLQPTALVHEVYLKLFRQREVEWQNRNHFFSVAAQQIRRILVDHARRRNSDKRCGKLLRVTLIEDVAATPQDVDLLALDDALFALDTASSEDRQIVEMKYFAGMTEKEIGETLDISERTVRRRWEFIRTWLFRQLKQGAAGPSE
jgi:RNA polymerase sigma factor (TIGR02999 family)